MGRGNGAGQVVRYDTQEKEVVAEKLVDILIEYILSTGPPGI